MVVAERATAYKLIGKLAQSDYSKFDNPVETYVSSIGNFRVDEHRGNLG